MLHAKNYKNYNGQVIGAQREPFFPARYESELLSEINDDDDDISIHKSDVQNTVVHLFPFHTMG